MWNERAYQRGPLLENRWGLMRDWQRFLKQPTQLGADTTRWRWVEVMRWL